MSAKLHVRVQPGASRARIVGMLGDALKVAVTAPPEKGKANKAMSRLLANELGLAQGAVRVAAGIASRRKTVDIEGISQDALDKWLAGRVGGQT